MMNEMGNNKKCLWELILLYSSITYNFGLYSMANRIVFMYPLENF